MDSRETRLAGIAADRGRISLSRFSRSTHVNTNSRVSRLNGTKWYETRMRCLLVVKRYAPWYYVQRFFLDNLAFLCTLSFLIIVFLFSRRLCSKTSSLALSNAKTRAQIPCRLNTSWLKHNFIIKIRHRFFELFLEIMLVQSFPFPPLNVNKRILLHVSIPKLHPVWPIFPATCKHCPLIIPLCRKTRLHINRPLVIQKAQNDHQMRQRSTFDDKTLAYYLPGNN